MPRIDITQSHDVTQDEARRRLEGFHQQLEDRFGLLPTWISPTQVEVRRSGASGTLRIEPRHISVHIDLPFTLSPLKGRIESEIRRELARLFV